MEADHPDTGALFPRRFTQLGDLVHARGRLRNGSYEKDGQTIYTVDLVTTEFLLLAKHQPKDLVEDDAA